MNDYWSRLTGRAALKPGRWRCLICRPHRWRTGTYADWMAHYRTLHAEGVNDD